MWYMTERITAFLKWMKDNGFKIPFVEVWLHYCAVEKIDSTLEVQEKNFLENYRKALILNYKFSTNSKDLDRMLLSKEFNFNGRDFISDEDKSRRIVFNIDGLGQSVCEKVIKN